VFEEWNKGELDSFLIEITKNILAYKDTDGSPLVEKIRDAAGQVLYLITVILKRDMVGCSLLRQDYLGQFYVTRNVRVNANHQHPRAPPGILLFGYFSFKFPSPGQICGSNAPSKHTIVGKNVVFLTDIVTVLSQMPLSRDKA
jgi:hypothetical protein